MFDKMKQLYQMKKQMESTVSTEDYKGIKVTVNGAMKITSMEISDEAKNSSSLEQNVTKAINNALKNVQKKLQQEMMGSGGMNMPF